VHAQQSRTYIEPSRSRPIDDYRNARTLLQAFDADIRAKMAQNGGRRPLKGWKIVIDPGHGGMDPGAIVSNKDGVERSVYVVEDEYVYDIALRVYELLRLNGADVELTMISPNHLVRENLRASVTFVHEQNEVYNDEPINRKKGQSVRPGGRNLMQRVKIGNRFLKGARKGKSLFISLHADNSPGRPKGPLAIYLDRKGKIDNRSRKFAQVMRKALDQRDLPGQIAGRSLGVLRDNRAHAEILVEIHNVHDKGEAYRLRFHKIRQGDAEKILKGVLNYASGR
jgi:N-acetylmuramoyl-L-alanine amidase